MSNPSDDIIRKIYTPILNNAGIYFDDETGYLSVAGADGTKLPFSIEGKRWALPLRRNLTGDNADILVINPLKESLNTDANVPIISRIRLAYMAKINQELNVIAKSLITIVTSEALHPQLTGDQRNILTVCANMSNKTLEAYDKLMEAMQGNLIDKCIVSIFLRRGAVLNKVTYGRGAIVTWPLYAALKSDEEKVFGVKLTKKERENIITLFEFMIPGISQPDQYSYGSLHKHFAFMDSLLSSVASIQQIIQNHVGLYPDHMTDKIFEFNYDYIDVIENSDKYMPTIRLLPDASSGIRVTETRDIDRDRDDRRDRRDYDDDRRGRIDDVPSFDRDDRRGRRVDGHTGPGSGDFLDRIMGGGRNDRDDDRYDRSRTSRRSSRDDRRGRRDDDRRDRRDQPNWTGVTQSKDRGRDYDDDRRDRRGYRR